MDKVYLCEIQLHNIKINEQNLIFLRYTRKNKKYFREIHKKSDKPPPAKPSPTHRLSNRAADFKQMCEVGCSVFIFLTFYYCRAPPLVLRFQ